MLVSALVRAGSNLCLDVFTDRVLPGPAHLNLAESVSWWMDTSKSGKEATKRLHESSLELVRDPARAEAVEEEGNKIVVRVNCPDWEKATGQRLM
jgi:hypothetical protein